MTMPKDRRRTQPGMPGMELVFTGNPTQVAAEYMAAGLLAAAERAPGSWVRLAIPGGSALAAMSGVMAAVPGELWPRVALTWVDERCVPVADPESNRGTAMRRGLVPPGLGLMLPLWQDGETVDAALTRVQRGLQADFAGGADVVLLGMGEDGHVASLFPGHLPAHTKLSDGGLVAAISHSPKPPPNRMTLTLPVLGQAGMTVLLAIGEAKRHALERLMRRDPALPASHIDRLTVVTDLVLEETST